jgi:ABC-type transport system involved in Fe-S cluster assembly fused permease/ATPase subunit
MSSAFSTLLSKMPSNTDDHGLDLLEIGQECLPSFTILFYFIASGVKFVMSGRAKSPPVSSFLYNVLLSCQACVLVTYCFDLAVSIQHNFSRHFPPSEPDTILAGGSLLLWILLLSSGSSIDFPRGGCCVIYSVVESVFAAIHLTPIQVLRLLLLYFLSIVALCRAFVWLHQAPVRNNSEEHRPLLSRETSHDSDSEGTTEAPDNLYQVWDTLKYIMPYFWPEGNLRLQLLLIAVSVWVVLQRVLNAAVPIQLGYIINELNQERSFPWGNIVLYVFLMILRSSSQTVQNLLWMPLENQSYFRLATLAFNKIMELSSDFHDKKDSTRLWQSVNRGANVPFLIRSILFEVAPNIIDFGVTISVLHYLCGPYIGLLAMTVILLFFKAHKGILQQSSSARRDVISANVKSQGILVNSTSHWRTVTSFGHIEYEKNQYAAATQGKIQKNNQSQYWSYIESTATSWIIDIGLLCSLLLAAWKIFQGQQSIGNIITLQNYWYQLSGPLVFFAKGFENLSFQMISAEELVALLQRQPSVTDHSEARSLVIKGGQIEFNNVTFSYDGKNKVLNEISFRCLPGQTVAFVGESGGGKSTVTKLISRYYDISNGSIQIDKQDIRSVTIDSLRKAIAVVPQEHEILKGTIMYNIRYANMSATDQDVQRVCKAVQLHDHISKLSDGYDTEVGENGTTLSGGQIQRLGIARALLKDPSIFVLDEATSAVDSLTEAEIQQTLGKYTKGRTTIVIAHRLSTIIKADLIVALRDGMIVEQGTHQELLQSQGYYHNLWTQQTASDTPMLDKNTSRASN